VAKKMRSRDVAEGRFMRTLFNLLLLLALLLVAACNRVKKEQPPQAPSPVAQDSPTPQSKSSHPNQVSVSIGKTSPEIARLKPRFIEAYSPASVKLERTDSMPQGFPTTPQTPDESPQAGMKWLVVIVELDATQGEVSVPINKIRIADQSNRTYRLISFGGSDSDTFTDLREMDKYKMVEPPKLMIRSPTASKQTMLFAVASKAQGLSLEF
jgi:hypothetical protein